MSSRVWLLRHGDTEWTEEARHTGRREIPLSAAGREEAQRAGRLLATSNIRIDHVFVSPQLRARQTCELAGVAVGRDIEPREELVEWDYGELEGLTDEQTRERLPDWDLFRDGAPGGESPAQVTRRVERMIEHTRGVPGTCLLVAHGKLLRALAARWIGAELTLATALPMDPAAISLLEREGETPLLRLWNYTGQP